MRRRKLTNIEADRYDELFYFCKQYKNREKRIESLYGLKGMGFDDMPHGSDVGNPTEQTAIMIDKLKTENALIRKCAEEVSHVFASYILKNVTEGIAYEYLEPPCGRRQFYDMRREFFKKLSKER